MSQHHAWRVLLADRGPCRRYLLCSWAAVLLSLVRCRALGLLDRCFFQQRAELLVDPPSFQSLGLWATAEEQGHSSQVLGCSSEDLRSRWGFLVVEDVPVDIASMGLRWPASSGSEGRPLFVDIELEIV